MATDWPMWRYDAARTSSTPHELPESLHLIWERHLPTPKRAWSQQEDDADKLAFDVSYEPVVSNGLIYVPSMVRDRMTAYDAANGEEVWRFYTDGPIRFAPIAYNGMLYFVSDDGYLYCLDALDGTQKWKFRGSPTTQRQILGNERLIDTWPARGAPVIKDGIVYFAAGVWPHMGIFLHALDTVTGEVIWTNSGSGQHFTAQVHQSAGSHSGPAPQGYLAASGDMLMVPSGRSRPAAYRRSTGEFLYFTLVPRPWDRYPGMGGYAIMIKGDYFHIHGEANRLSDGQPLLQVRTPHLEILSTEERLQNRRAIRSIDHLPPGNISIANLQQELIGALHGRIASYDSGLKKVQMEVTDRRGEESIVEKYVLQELWAFDTDPPVNQVFLQAGSRIYGSGANGAIIAIDRPTGEDGELPNVQQIGVIEGTPWSMLAAEGRLYVVSEEGRIYCFSDEQFSGNVMVHKEPVIEIDSHKSRRAKLASEIVKNSGVNEGYAIVIGSENLNFLEELIRQTELHFIVVSHERNKLTKIRRYFDGAGVYGSRLSVLGGDPFSLNLPPYFADLIVIENWNFETATPELLQQVYSSLRPYGGKVYLPVTNDEDDQWLLDLINTSQLENAEFTLKDNFIKIIRSGPLPNTGQWTHQNANSANTLVSSDDIQAPFGVLWFGGPTNEDVLPRHGRGPTPHVAGGRLIILGRDILSARDVYTGRLLWRKKLRDIGLPYDNVNHQAGADHVGSPYVTKVDAVYVRFEGKILKLDPDTGETVAEFYPGGQPGEETPVPLGYIGVWDDLLIAGVEAQFFDDSRPGRRDNWNATSSSKLVVMNRNTGERLWEREAEFGFRHNAIVLAAGRVFLVDRLSDGVLDLLTRRGQTIEGVPQLIALDARTGEEIWNNRQDVFGSWLGYSEEHDILLQSSRIPVDRRQALPDEPRPGERMDAYRGRDGKLVWKGDFSYRNAPILHGDKLILHQDIYDLFTGEPYQRIHPVTGEQISWTYAPSSNCGQIVASNHLLTFRRGTASYYDLNNAWGTGDISGIRAGCTPNMIPADGVLSIPDYTRTCVCQYQLQTSLALVHMDEAEKWLVDVLEPSSGPVKRIGKNFGARGYTMDNVGTLWAAYPAINVFGGTSKESPFYEQTQNVGSGTPEQIAVHVMPDNPGWTRFYHHSSLFDGEEVPAWVVSSGIEGMDSVALTLAEYGKEREYTVRMYFSEPGSATGGQRVFSVFLQGQSVLENLDIRTQAGSTRRGFMKEFTNVSVQDILRVDFHSDPNTVYPPVISGIEVILHN